MAVLPCFLCGKQLDQRTDKNNKPYFICNPCGMQIFIRRELGIKKLEELIRNLKEGELALKKHAQVFMKCRPFFPRSTASRWKSSDWISKSVSSSSTKTNCGPASCWKHASRTYCHSWSRSLHRNHQGICSRQKRHRGLDGTKDCKSGGPGRTGECPRPELRGTFHALQTTGPRR